MNNKKMKILMMKIIILKSNPIMMNKFQIILKKIIMIYITNNLTHSKKIKNPLIN